MPEHAGFINAIPSAPSVESLVVRITDMENRLDERFEMNRTSLIQMLSDSERVMGAKVENIHGLLTERDLRREQRYLDQEKSQSAAMQSTEKRVDAAFTALKHHTSLMFDASDKAITKSEMAQQAYNNTHNDLSTKMDQQYKSMIPRPEHQAQMAAHEEKMTDLKEAQIALRIEMMKEIQNLRESRSMGEGESTGKINQQQAVTWIIGLGLAAIVVGGVIVDIAFRLK